MKCEDEHTRRGWSVEQRNPRIFLSFKKYLQWEALVVVLTHQHTEGKEQTW